MKLSKSLATSALMAFAVLAGASAANAAPSSDTAGTDVVGGNPTTISAAPWAVQIHTNATGTSFNCSGSLISADWVLTAKHCEHTQSVRLGTASNGVGGEVRTVVEDRAWAGGDMRLLKLSSSYYGTSVTLDHDATSTGLEAKAYGWGRTCAICSASPTLKTANVTIESGGTDWYGGPAVVTRGGDGQVYKGDSGGPLIVNGQQVGVLSSGGGNPDDIDRTANYAYVKAGMSWISSISGVTGR